MLKYIMNAVLLFCTLSLFAQSDICNTDEGVILPAGKVAITYVDPVVPNYEGTNTDDSITTQFQERLIYWVHGLSGD